MKRKKNSIVNSSPRIGRNDPCPCGSRKKYKKCCLIREMIRDQAMAIAQASTSISSHIHTEECHHDHVSETDQTATGQ